MSVSGDFLANLTDTALPGDGVPTSYSPMAELGSTGLRRFSGYVDEEFLPQLRGRKAVQIYREMADNDPIVGALLFAIDRLVRQVEWRVEPASGTPEAKKAAQFVEECMNDMSHTWDEFVAEVATMNIYGWSWHEIVYKKRIGPWESDSKKRSKYTDGRIGWRKIPIRSQETWLRWVFDESGGVKAMVQLAPPTYKLTVIPIEKSLLFRTTTTKNNPEGRSLLRNAYRPWYMKKRLEEIEGIGVERDLAGLPIAKIPASYLNAKAGSDQQKMVEAFRKMVRSVRRDEQEGIILPQAFDPDTNQPLFGFELLTSGGGRTFNTNEIINRYEQRMLMSVLADFIMVGHSGTGSYALHTDKTGLFRASMNSITRSIANTLNSHAIPRLFAINGWKTDELPKFVPGDIDPPDLNQLSSFMNSMSAAGVNWFPDEELEKFLRTAARLPEMGEEAEGVKEQMTRQSLIIQMAQQKLQAIQLEQQAAQGAMSMQQQEMQTQTQQMNMEQQAQQMQSAPEQQASQSAKEDENHALQTEKQKLEIEAQKKAMAQPQPGKGKK